MSTATREKKAESRAARMQIESEIYDNIMSDEPARLKRAALAVDDYVKDRVREDLILDAILPAIPLTADQLDRGLGDEGSMKIDEKENGSPVAVTVGYGSFPENYQLKGIRFSTSMARIRSQEFIKDVAELRNYVMDIRMMMSDNAVRDILFERDANALAAIETMLIGAGSVVPQTGQIQHREIAGGISREGLAAMLETMPSTKARIETHTCLLNNITIKRMYAWGRGEWGGDMAQDIITNGWSLQEFMNCRWLITIKQEIVPNNRFFNFGHPDHLGKHYEMESMTMHVKKEAYEVRWFHYWEGGLTWANLNALCIHDFVL